MWNKRPPSDNYMAFLKRMHSSGAKLSEEQKNTLFKEGYVKEEQFQFLTQNNNEPQSTKPVLAETEEKENYKASKDLRTNVHISEWQIPSKTIYEPEFIAWIDSINTGIENKRYYERFDLYCQQAYAWLQEPYDDTVDRDEWETKEIEKCKENTLYFIEKYCWVQEQDPMADIPEFRYEARVPHRILIYLYDLGLNIIFAKGRQIAASTTFGLCMLKTLVFRTNAYIKFVSQDEDKGQEIFDFKVKYPYTRLPEFMRPDSKNYAAGKMSFGYGKKGEKEGANTMIEVAPPNNTVISGGSPTEIILDEAGNMKNLGKIIENGLPTLFGQDRATGEIRMKRRLIAFGTGGEMTKGGDAFQTEFMTIKEKWDNRDFRFCIVPLFFNWKARPGITMQFYNMNKDLFYSKIGPEAEKSKIEFHQQYPDTLEDVFMRTANTLVDSNFLNNQLKRIRESGAKIKRGYFEPIYGKTPMPEGSDIPFNIEGVNFVPTEDIDPRATVTIFMDPEKGWVNRYYQGTDPIAADSGQSNMASAIWDKHFNTISAVVDFRSQDTNYVYLQVLLLGLYFSEDGINPIPELLESNMGKAYSMYKMGKGKKYEKSLVLNSELPDGLQNKTNLQYGIDTKGPRKRIMVNKLYEVITAFADRIFLPIIFQQLKTFHCNVSDKGNELWGPLDRRYHKDDTLDGTTFAYICSQCFPSRICQNKNPEAKKTKIVSKLVRDKDLHFKRIYVKQTK
jgi:hypothetical protein